MFSKVLTIAGSDSGGGAGIQADLKTFTALGVYGTSVVTALTAQNTLGVAAIFTPDADFIFQQYEAVMTDIGADAAKTGMLADGGVIEAVARGLERWPIDKLVVDPVMVSTSGDPLLEDEAVDRLCKRIIPKACLLTPNVPEAEALTGRSIASGEAMESAAKALVAMGARAVLIKGGHLEDSDRCDDLYYDGNRFRLFEGRRIRTVNTHGSGCTLSAAIAAFLARGLDLAEAIGRAKRYTSGAIESALEIGGGPGPLHHGFAIGEPPP